MALEGTVGHSKIGKNRMNKRYMTELTNYMYSSNFRWFTLDDSAVYYKGDLVSDAKGEITFVVPGDGTNGDINTYILDAGTPGGGTQYHSNNSAHWDVYADKGDVLLSSYVLIASSLKWDTRGFMNYKENKYIFLAEDLYTNSDYKFLAAGNGGYGASSVKNWYVFPIRCRFHT